MTNFFTCNEASYALDHCPTCGVAHMFPRALYDTARRSKKNGAIYCPNGHGWHYNIDTPEDQLRRERDLLKQRLAQKDDQISLLHAQKTSAERSLTATKGHLTKVRTRISQGVCPCCHRTFSNMARHMTAKHPQFKTEEVT